VTGYTNSQFASRNSQLKNLDAVNLSRFTSVSNFSWSGITGFAVSVSRTVTELIIL